MEYQDERAGIYDGMIELPLYSVEDTSGEEMIEVDESALEFKWLAPGLEMAEISQDKPEDIELSVLRFHSGRDVTQVAVCDYVGFSYELHELSIDLLDEYDNEYVCQTFLFDAEHNTLIRGSRSIMPFENCEMEEYK